MDGSGAYIFPDPESTKSSECYEGSNFAAYKVRDTPVSTMYSTSEVRMRNMTFIDNHKGVYLSTAGERSYLKTVLADT